MISVFGEDKVQLLICKRLTGENFIHYFLEVSMLSSDCFVLSMYGLSLVTTLTTLVQQMTGSPYKKII